MIDEKNTLRFSNEAKIIKTVFSGLFFFGLLAGIGLYITTDVGGFEVSIIAYIIPIVLSGVCSFLFTWNKLKPDEMLEKINGLIFSFYFLAGAIHFEIHRTGNYAIVFLITISYLFMLALPFLNEKLAVYSSSLLQSSKQVGTISKKGYVLLLIISTISVSIGRAISRSMSVAGNAKSYLILLEILLVILALVVAQFTAYQIFALKQEENRNLKDFTFARIKNPEVLKMIKSGHFDSAISFINEKYPEISNDKDLLLARALCFYNLKRFKEAAQDLDRIVELDLNHVYARIYRAKTLQGLGYRTQAIADYSKAIELEPGIGVCYVQRGKLYIEAKEYELALDDAESARIRNEVSQSFAIKAIVSTEEGEYQEAIDYWNKYLKMQRDDPNALCCRGLLFIKTDRERLGIEDIKKAMNFEDEINDSCKLETKEILRQYENGQV